MSRHRKSFPFPHQRTKTSGRGQPVKAKRKRNSLAMQREVRLVDFTVLESAGSGSEPDEIRP